MGTIPFSRQHVMSSVSEGIAKRALEHLSKQAPQITDDQPRLGSRRVPFESASTLGFSYMRFGLYKLSTDDVSIPTIWKKEMFADPKTGEKSAWLVAYTTDDEDVERGLLSEMSKSAMDDSYVMPSGMQASPDVIVEGTRVFNPVTGFHGTVTKDVRPGMENAVVAWDETGERSLEKPEMLEVMASKTAGASAALRAIAEPKKPDMPIAPGVVNKNLTLDQGGAGGKATVTVEFNDPQKGEEFFKQVEDLTSDVGGGQPQPAEAEAEEAPKEPPVEPQASPAPEGGAPQGAPVPAPEAGGLPPLASTVRQLTRFGTKITSIMVEKCAGFNDSYFFVNEDGQRIKLAWQAPLKSGTSFLRPDNQENVRIGAYVVQTIESDTDILASLLAPKTAVDVSDQVPPMGWTNNESQNTPGEVGQPLPPNPALQEGAAPSADTQQQPLYNSDDAASQGAKPKYNVSIDPNNSAVTVKFDKAPALDAIDQAVQGQQPQLNNGVAPQAPAAPAPSGQQQRPDFNETESPLEF